MLTCNGGESVRTSVIVILNICTSLANTLFLDYGNKIHDRYRYSNIVNDWKAAIGLQAVDGLQPSDYLYELAGKHIQGEVDCTGRLEINQLHKYF